MTASSISVLVSIHGGPEKQRSTERQNVGMTFKGCLT